MYFMLKMAVYAVPPQNDSPLDTSYWLIEADSSTEAWKLAETFASQWYLNTKVEFSDKYVGWVFTDQDLPADNGQMLVRLIEFRPITVEEFIKLACVLDRYMVNKFVEQEKQAIVLEEKPKEEAPNENLDK